MRLWHFALLLAGPWIVVGLVWGLDAALLYFFFGAIAMFVAAYSTRDGRLTVKSVLWGLARLCALLVGAAWRGFWAGVGLLLAVIVMQVIAELAEAVYLRRSAPSDGPER